jgi:hypothetical protein
MLLVLSNFSISLLIVHIPPLVSPNSLPRYWPPAALPAAYHNSLDGARSLNGRPKGTQREAKWPKGNARVKYKNGHYKTSSDYSFTGNAIN